MDQSLHIIQVLMVVIRVLMVAIRALIRPLTQVIHLIQGPDITLIPELLQVITHIRDILLIVLIPRPPILQAIILPIAAVMEAMAVTEDTILIVVVMGHMANTGDLPPITPDLGA